MAYIVDQVLTNYAPDLEFSPAKVATPKTRRANAEDNHLDLFARAKHHFQDDEFELAAESCAAAIDRFYEQMSDREKGSAHSFYGSTLMRLQRWEEAAGQFEICAQLSPAEAEHWHRLGRAYDFLGRRKDAIAALERAAEISPSDAGVKKSLARARSVIGSLKASARRPVADGLLDSLRRLLGVRPEPVSDETPSRG